MTGTEPQNIANYGDSNEERSLPERARNVGLVVDNMTSGEYYLAGNPRLGSPLKVVSIIDGNGDRIFRTMDGGKKVAEARIAYDINGNPLDIYIPSDDEEPNSLLERGDFDLGDGWAGKWSELLWTANDLITYNPELSSGELVDIDNIGFEMQKGKTWTVTNADGENGVAFKSINPTHVDVMKETVWDLGNDFTRSTPLIDAWTQTVLIQLVNREHGYEYDRDAALYQDMLFVCKDGWWTAYASDPFDSASIDENAFVQSSLTTGPDMREIASGEAAEKMLKQIELNISDSINEGERLLGEVSLRSAGLIV